MTSIDRMSVERLAEYISPDVRRVMLAQADRIEELEAKLAMAANIATLALDALYEVQTYEQPDDSWDENALTMHELNAFDFNVEAARTTLAELTGGHKDD